MDGLQTNNMTRLGLGISGPLGASWFSETKAMALIERALALGITAFDTSPLYGLAEERLGRALAPLNAAERAGLCLSTKVGNYLGTDGKRRRDFSAGTIRRLVDQSLTRLGVDAVDVVYLHGPDEHELLSSLPILFDLKAQGLIRQTGVCSEGSHLGRAIAQDGVDAVMGSYNLFDRRHETMLETARESGLHVTGIAPLGQGLYRPGFLLPRSPADLWYIARAMVKNRRQFALARQLSWMNHVNGWTGAELALTFALTGPLDRAMMTTTRITHLEANVAAARRVPPAHIMAKLSGAADA